MYFLYRILTYGALPFALIRILYKGKGLPGYRQRIQERFGIPGFPNISNSIWIHAVSVGESNAAIPLVKRIKDLFPQIPIVVTTTTPTGSDNIIKTLKDKVFHSYFPYDAPLIVKKFISHVKPICFIVLETEIWPNLFNELHKRDVPIFLVNARLSPSSFKGYLKVKRFISRTLSTCTNILTQNQEYADKYIELGAPRQRVIATGNIKFDIPVPEDMVKRGEEIKKEVFKGIPVWIGASTHEGEERELLKIHLNLLKKYRDLKFILVPRHPDRFSPVFELCRSFGLSVYRRSSGLAPPSPDFQVYLGDSMGEMMIYYAMSDIAFVGGSLVKRGGHNLLEPAILGLPILTGPYLFNFQDIADILRNSKGILVGKDPADIEKKLIHLLDNKGTRIEIGLRAKKITLENKGALDKTLDIIVPAIQKAKS